MLLHQFCLDGPCQSGFQIELTKQYVIETTLDISGHETLSGTTLQGMLSVQSWRPMMSGEIHRWNKQLHVRILIYMYT